MFMGPNPRPKQEAPVLHQTHQPKSDFPMNFPSSPWPLKALNGPDVTGAAWTCRKMMGFHPNAGNGLHDVACNKEPIQGMDSHVKTSETHPEYIMTMINETLTVPRMLCESKTCCVCFASLNAPLNWGKRNFWRLVSLSLSLLNHDISWIQHSTKTAAQQVFFIHSFTLSPTPSAMHEVHHGATSEANTTIFRQGWWSPLGWRFLRPEKDAQQPQWVAWRLSVKMC